MDNQEIEEVEEVEEIEEVEEPSEPAVIEEPAVNDNDLPLLLNDLESDTEEIVHLLEQILLELEKDKVQEINDLQNEQLQILNILVEQTKPIEVEEVSVFDEELSEKEELEIYSNISVIVISFLLIIMMMYKLIQSVFNTLTRHII